MTSNPALAHPHDFVIDADPDVARRAAANVVLGLQVDHSGDNWNAGVVFLSRLGLAGHSDVAGRALLRVRDLKPVDAVEPPEYLSFALSLDDQRVPAGV